MKLVPNPISIGSPSSITSDMNLATAFKVYILPVTAAVVLSHIANTAIDRVIVKEDEEKRIENFYADMMKKVEASNLPRREEPPDMRDVRDMSSLIEDSLSSLQKAQKSLEAATGKTKCGVCKESLSKATEVLKSDLLEVKENTRGIMSASKKYSALRRLKSMGKVDKSKKWTDLTMEEKDMVRSIVEER
jgi:hypothetical protein